MKNNIYKDSMKVFIIAFFAKVLGFLKTVIQASFLGASLDTDAFNVANGFVNNILYMLSLAIAVSFVPLYTQHRLKGKEESEKFGTKVITALLIASVGIAFILALLSPVIIHIIAPSYSGEVFDKSVSYFRVLAIGFSFSMGAHIYSSLLNAEKVYGYTSLCSICNSLILVIFIILLSNKIGLWALVISVPVSYMVQWLALYIKGRRFAKISLKYGIKDEAIKNLLLVAAPVLISQATVEINQVIDKALLTTVTTGAVTAVSYAASLYLFATALISTPLSTVMFTELSEAGAKKNYARMGVILTKCYKFIIIVCIPITIIIRMCSTDIVSIVYAHGNYGGDAILNTAIGLSMYGLCLFPVCIKTVLGRAYYALEDTRRPMVIGIIEVVVNITLSVILVKSYGIAGVVGATAIASAMTMVIMVVDFDKKYIKVLDKQNLKSFVKILISIAILLPISIIASKWTINSSFMNFAVKSIIVCASLFIVLLFIKENTLLDTLHLLRLKISKKKPS